MPDGLVAGPSSSAYPIEGRNIRLVRSGERELALQLEVFNGTDESISFGDLGLDYREQLISLVDPARGTAYGPVNGSTREGRISEDTDIEPGRSATLTAVFAAPAKEVTQLLVVVDNLLPVVVPIQDQELTDDPVLQGAHNTPQTGPLICKTGGKGGASEVFKLPSDVLFDFGSATLTPAAKVAIQAMRERVSASSGKVTVDGHTDAVGSNPANQRLSEQRAAAVNQVLRGELGGEFTYEAAGHGETQPVAPNTRGDGSDDPDGRAQNRRVEVTVETAEPSLERRSGSAELSDAGLTAQMAGAERLGGYTLVKVKVANPTTEAQPLDYANHFTPKALTTGQLSLSDPAAQTRYELCGFAEPTYFDFVGTLSQAFAPGKLGVLPAGAEVTLWGLFPAPGKGTTAVKVELAGFADLLDGELTTS